MDFAHLMLLQITTDVCGSKLGLSRFRVLDRSEITDGEESLEGSIRITGEWDLELRVVCPRAVAVQLTIEMYDKTVDELSEENIRDALREVIGVIGSDVRDALGGNDRLSCPRVRESVSPFDTDIPPGQGDFHGDILTVHLVETTRDAAFA